MICKDIQRNLSDYLEKKVSDSQKSKFEEHLQQCANCRAELDALKTVISEASILERVAAPDSLWTRIESELDFVDAAIPVKTSKHFSELWDRFEEAFRIPIPAIKTIGVLAILLIGIFLGRNFFPARESANLAHQTDVQGAETELISQRADRYFEKSKILFLGIVNAETRREENPNWSTEKRVAQNLVKEAAFLKDGLSQMRNERIKQLVEELELILLEIAHLEEQHNVENIELIKSGIDRKGLLLKINLHDLSANQRPSNSNSMKNIL